MCPIACTQQTTITTTPVKLEWSQRWIFSQRRKRRKKWKRWENFLSWLIIILDIYQKFFADRCSGDNAGDARLVSTARSPTWTPASVISQLVLRSICPYEFHMSIWSPCQATRNLRRVGPLIKIENKWLVSIVALLITDQNYIKCKDGHMAKK